MAGQMCQGIQTQSWSLMCHHFQYNLLVQCSKAGICFLRDISEIWCGLMESPRRVQGCSGQVYPHIQPYTKVEDCEGCLLLWAGRRDLEGRGHGLRGFCGQRCFLLAETSSICMLACHLPISPMAPESRLGMQVVPHCHASLQDVLRHCFRTW